MLYIIAIFGSVINSTALQCDYKYDLRNYITQAYIISTYVAGRGHRAPAGTCIGLS